MLVMASQASRSTFTRRESLIDPKIEVIVINKTYHWKFANLANQCGFDKVFIKDEFDVFEDWLNCVGAPLITTYLGKVSFDQLEDLGTLLTSAAGK